MTQSDRKWGKLIDDLQFSRRDFIFSVGAAGALTLAPRFASAQAGRPYKIGVLLPSTGTGANYMAHAIKGLPVAIAELNKRGGLLGKHQIEMIYRDTETKPDVGAREAKSLILNDKVDAIFGTYSSAVALAIQEIIHEHKVLHFAATSNSSKITQDNFTPYTYQFCPDSNMQSGAVVVAVAKMAKKNNWKSFVSIGQDYEWGRDTHRGFTTGFAKVAPGVKESRQLWFKLGETDFTSYITAIMAAKPDFLYGAIAGKDSETFLQQAGQMGLFKRVPFPGGLITVTELKSGRKTLPRGMIGLARCPFFAHLDQPIMQAYIKRDRAAFGPEGYPDDWACMYYDALGGLDQGTKKANSIETEAIIKALKGATIDTCRGQRAFRDCSNQLEVPSYVGEVWDSPDYPFPIYKPDTMVVVEAKEVWTPTCEEVDKLKKKRA
ncbi:MAG: ABC transporter substrate-binding protein [Burkholderiaceae bacterium]|nr:ABC transporter substrate-binding protein [Burkholderiaceae bacterium]